METSRLKHFRTVVETQNLRRAADLLGISHSGLSKSLKALESELGLTLLMPSGRGLVVTDDGMRIYQRSESVLQAVEGLTSVSHLQALRIRIGSFEVFTSFFIADLVRQHFKDADVEVHDLMPGRLEEALINDRIDVGITYDPVPRAGIDYTKVTSVRMGAFARRDAFADTSFADIPFVVPVRPIESAPSGVRGSDAWPGERFPRRVGYRVDLLNTGLALVRQGVCAVFMPEFVAFQHNKNVDPVLRLRELELPKGMPVVNRDVYVVRRESSPEDATVKRIARSLRSLED
jgi:DNA-binding transcriptional LysR family regulator